MKKILTVCIMLMFLLMTVSSANVTYIEKQSIKSSSFGNTLYVGGSGPNNYTNIQDAINDSLEGDTIFVYNGVYYENLVINKGINLIGEGKISTVIDGKEKEDTILITSDNASISEFTIQNSNDAGVEIDSYFCFCNISDNIIIDHLTGISLDHSDNNIIEDNTFINNRDSTIEGYVNNDNVISGNTIENTYNSYCIALGHSTGNNISYNIIDNCFDGILLFESDNNVVYCNVISSGEYDGIIIKGGSNNQIIGNNISYHANSGINIMDGSNFNIIYHNNIANNRITVATAEGDINYWDDGKYGNYWSDYRLKYPFAKKLRKEGIWDTPYEISEDNKDNYPLIKRWPEPIFKISSKSENVLFQRWIDRFPLINQLIKQILERWNI